LDLLLLLLFLLLLLLFLLLLLLFLLLLLLFLLLLLLFLLLLLLLFLRLLLLQTSSLASPCTTAQSSRPSMPQTVLQTTMVRHWQPVRLQQLSLHGDVAATRLVTVTGGGFASGRSFRACAAHTWDVAATRARASYHPC
jgi:hypothetical protein